MPVRAAQPPWRQLHFQLDLPDADGVVKFSSVVTVRDSSGYEDLSEIHNAQHVSQQSIEAKRVGDCPAGRAPPKNPNPKPPPHP